MNCSVVIPVFYSEGTLGELIARLGTVLPGVSPKFEVLLVNDGSRDRSWETICELAQTYSWVRGINLMRNYGQHNALLAGIRAAVYECIVTMDDDLQNPPEEISALLEKLAEGYDVVYGTPQIKQHDLGRVITSQIARRVLDQVMGNEMVAIGSGFRAFRSELRDAFADYHSPFVVIDVLLTWGTTRIAAIPVRHDKRKAGRSTYSFLKLALLALDVTTSSSSVPLRLVSWVGFGITLIGLGFFIYAVRHILIGAEALTIVEWIGSILVILAGIQLLALGIMGEYFARIHFSVMGKPSYVECGRTGSKSIESASNDV